MTTDRKRSKRQMRNSRRKYRHASQSHENLSEQSILKQRVSFPEQCLESSRQGLEGGFLWNRFHKKTVAEVEDSAFDRLKAFAFIEKNKSSKDFSNIKRVQILKQQVGNDQPSFSKYLISGRNKSVTDKVSFHNVQSESSVVYQKKPIKTTYFSDLQSTQLRLIPPIDFSDYLISKSRTNGIVDALRSTQENDTILRDGLLAEVVTRTPFFSDVESFKSACDAIETLSYKQRAYVYYVFGEYYLQAFYRASSLYNVELMTYFTTLFEKFEIPSLTTSDSKSKDRVSKHLKRYKIIKERLKKGELGVDMTFGSDNYGLNVSSSALVDRDTGLPLESPLLHYGRGWPFSKKLKTGSHDHEDFAQLKVKSVAQMAELLLNEPVIDDKDPLDHSKRLKQLYLFKTFEPIVSSDLSCLNDDFKDKSILYVEDLRCKMLIALRELRKNILLNLYHDAVSPGRAQASILIEKLQKEFSDREKSNDIARRKSKIEFTLGDVFDKVLKPVDEQLTDKVRENFVTAGKKLSTLKFTKESKSDVWLDFSDMQSHNPLPDIVRPSNLRNQPLLLENRPIGHRVKL